MPRQELPDQWTLRVTGRMPALTPRQARVPALRSFGMVLCRRRSLPAVAPASADVLGRSENSLRQRPRERYQEASRKRGRLRRELDASVRSAPAVGGRGRAAGGSGA